MCQALKILGWNPLHAPRNLAYFNHCNAAADVLCTLHYKFLNARWPDSLFILNTRPFEHWLESLQRCQYFWNKETNAPPGFCLGADHDHTVDLVTRLFGSVYGNRAAVQEAYDRHHQDVQHWFRHKPAQLKVLNIETAAWPELCDFLGQPVPKGEPFPWSNRSYPDEKAMPGIEIADQDIEWLTPQQSRWLAMTHGQTALHELQWLQQQVSQLSPGAAWADVGVWCGRSLLATSLALPADSTLYAIDLWSGEMERGVPNFDPCPDWSYNAFLNTARLIAQQRPDVKLEVRRQLTVEALGKLADDSLDGGFIDASHKRPEVEADIDALYPKIKPGGLICGHDFDLPGVYAAVLNKLPHYWQGAGSIWFARKPE
jgi:hypothetical protein